MRYLKKTNEDGMSLVEIMLAVAIFVIGVVSVAHLFVGSQISLAYTLDKSQAILLAKQGVEEQRYNRDIGDVFTEETNNPISLNEKEFSRTVSVSEVEGVATITSTVNWNTTSGEEEVYLVEIITDWKSNE